MFKQFLIMYHEYFEHSIKRSKMKFMSKIFLKTISYLKKIDGYMLNYECRKLQVPIFSFFIMITTYTSRGVQLLKNNEYLIGDPDL